MTHPSPRAELILLEADRLLQARIARVLSASSGFEPVCVVQDVIELGESLTAASRLLVFPDLDLDLALQLAESWPGLRLAVMHREVTVHALSAMESSAALVHMLSWPDFSPTPRVWDMAQAARGAQPGSPPCSWRDLLPAWSSSACWPLYSSFDRDTAIEQVSAVARTLLVDERLVESITEVAYEMAMNAMYDAPVDAAGRPRYSHDRQCDIALEDHEVPTLELASDGSVLVLQVEDPFGRLERKHILSGIGRGLGARTARGSHEVLDTGRGGAGLGIFRMFQLATSLTFDVTLGRATRVLALFDLTLRVRDRRTFPASLHLMFR